MEIEQQIQAKGLTAPRITPADIEAVIVSEHYFTAGQAGGVVLAGPATLPFGLTPEQSRPAALDLITICVLILRNGHRIVGVNEGPVSGANFDAELGHKMARQKAIDQIWPLLGYELRSKLDLIPGGLASASLPGMTVHVGTKAIRAKPMTRQAYNDLRGWTLPAGEKGSDLGCLVEYLDGGAPNVPGFDGYVSWSPAAVFIRAYGPPLAAQQEN